MGGIIAQFIGNYQLWLAEGGYIGAERSPPLPSCNPFDTLAAAITLPYGLMGCAISMVLFVLVIFVLMRMGSKGKGRKDRERNLTYSEKGTYGTAAFLDDETIKEFLHIESDTKKTSETILGKLPDGRIVCVPADSWMNRNLSVAGTSGSMKSRAYSRNMLFQCARRGESVIVTDPKGELYGDYCKYLESKGYLVKVFNTDHPECSDGWDFIGEIQRDELLTQITADVMIKNTGSVDSDPFWDNCELNLLKALILYVEARPSNYDRTMREVYRLITVSNDTGLAQLFAGLPQGHPAKVPYAIFMQQEATVRGKIINGLATRLQVFQSEAICAMTGEAEIDLTRPGKQKCAYFCISSDQHSTFDFLCSLFMTFLFIRLIRFADAQPGKKLPVPVHILAEELPNIGAIPDLCKKISTIRSRAASLSCVFQSIPQMQNRYPDNQWLEIIGNCDVQIFMGCTDPITAEFISTRAGTASVEVSSESKMLGTWRISDYTPEYRQTQSIGRRELLSVDEVLRLPMDEEIVVLRGKNVLKLKKLDYTEHADFMYLKPCNATDHVPDWRQRGHAPKKQTEVEPVKIIQQKQPAQKTLKEEIQTHNVVYIDKEVK